MSETRDAFGPLLEKLQAEMRNMRAEQTAYQEALRTFIATLVNRRAEETEAHTQSLFDRLMQRMDQPERSIHERLTISRRNPET